jgi:hypothetical protein
MFKKTPLSALVLALFLLFALFPAPAKAWVEVSIDESPGLRETTIPAQAITGNSTYELVAVIKISVQSNFKIQLVGTTSVATLTGFKITGAAKQGGTHIDLRSDAELNTATVRFPEATNNIYTSTAGSVFGIWMDTAGLHEIKIYAKSAGAAAIAFQIGR